MILGPAGIVPAPVVSGLLVLDALGLASGVLDMTLLWQHANCSMYCVLVHTVYVCDIAALAGLPCGLPCAAVHLC